MALNNNGSKLKQTVWKICSFIDRDLAHYRVVYEGAKSREDKNEGANIKYWCLKAFLIVVDQMLYTKCFSIGTIYWYHRLYIAAL